VPDDGYYVSRNTLHDLQQIIVTHTAETDDPLFLLFTHHSGMTSPTKAGSSWVAVPIVALTAAFAANRRKT
jgi:hypothetical protein